jgi:hypothetical protein
MTPVTQISSAFFVAQRKDDGTPGRPIGAGAGMLLFESLDDAIEASRSGDGEGGELAVYRINLCFCGQVVL